MTVLGSQEHAESLRLVSFEGLDEVWWGDWRGGKAGISAGSLSFCISVLQPRLEEAAGSLCV